MFRMMNKLKNRKGFTLIELIVVLAVLAIIMAIAVPKFLGVQEIAKEDGDSATLGGIAKAAELCYIREGDATKAKSISHLEDNNYIEKSIDFQSKKANVSGSSIVITLDTENSKVTKVKKGAIQYPK